MNRCPITYRSCEGRYGAEGLRLLSPRLSGLADLPLNASEQRREAVKRAGKMSIQGVQVKLSARLNIPISRFDIVDRMGDFIIKPQNDIYPELPENEGITMRMASEFGIETPVSGLVASADGSYSYFIRRFDRLPKGRKLAVEDFAQLSSVTSDMKYHSSMEKVAGIISTYCTFPQLEKRKLLRRVLFCFICGNEDMHLKNFSLVRREGKVELSPAYDLLNTSIVMDGIEEEAALPLAGKKSRLKKEDFLDYFGKERLQLPAKAVNAELEHLMAKKADLQRLLRISFLSEHSRTKYLQLMDERYRRFE